MYIQSIMLGLRSLHRTWARVCFHCTSLPFSIIFKIKTRVSSRTKIKLNYCKIWKFLNHRDEKENEGFSSSTGRFDKYWQLIFNIDELSRKLFELFDVQYFFARNYLSAKIKCSTCIHRTSTEIDQKMSWWQISLSWSRYQLMWRQLMFWTQRTQMNTKRKKSEWWYKNKRQNSR